MNENHASDIRVVAGSQCANRNCPYRNELIHNNIQEKCSYCHELLLHPSTSLDHLGNRRSGLVANNCGEEFSETDCDPAVRCHHSKTAPTAETPRPVSPPEAISETDHCPSSPPPSEDQFNCLPDSILSDTILPFVGIGQYRYVAGVDARFRRCYRECWNLNCKTTYQRAVASVACARVFVADPTRRFITHQEFICETAARYGRLEVLQWAHQQDYPWNEWTCSSAVKNGHLEVLQWLHQNGCPWNELTCRYAAENGYLDILQWARHQRCPWNARTCSAAARNGHLEILKWARHNNCPWDIWTCTNAAWHGHLKVLQWAHEQGCPWDEETCARAAENGHLAVLRWSRQQRCPWNSSTCRHAVENGHLEVLQWARDNGCPWDEETRAIAAERGFVE